MSVKSQDDFLSKIFCFTIRRRSNFIKDCQEGLLRSVIFNAGNPGMDVSGILNQICKETLIEDFPRCIVERILKALCEKGEIRKEGDKYFLKKEEFKRIAEIIKKRKEILEKAKSEIVTRVKRKTASDNLSHQAALNIFQNFISGFLLAESNFIADVLSSRRDVHEIRSPMEVLDNALSEVKDVNIRNAIRRSIVETLESSNRKLIHILYESILNLVCLKMLSVDPSGSIWKEGDLSGKIFILDTNVLFALILLDHPQHEVTDKIIFAAKKLGVKCAFTKRTIQEWLEVLEKANQRFRFLNSTRPSLLRKVEDIFIYSYFKRKETDSSLTWDQYYSKMKQIENLADNLGIHVYEEKEEHISDAESLRILDHLSSEVYRSGRRRLDVMFIKSGSVSEHDAHHLLLVRRLREESPSRSLGPSCWFLTYDVSLLEADKALNSLLKSPHAAPSSLLVDTWVLISSLLFDKYLKRKEIADIFADLFRNHFSTPLRRISASMVVEVLSPYLSYKSLSDDDLKAVLDDERVKQLYFQLREVRLTDPRKARLIYDELHQRVDSIVWELLKI